MMKKQGKTKDHGARSRLSSLGTAASISKSLRRNKHPYEPLPELQLIYDTAPVGLAFLTSDCRYVRSMND
jgi:hypothetical protein